MDPAQFIPKINLGKLFEPTNLKLPGGFTIYPSYFHAIAIVALIFLLLLTLGSLRRRFTHWQVAGIMPGLLFGIILTVIIEGFLIVGGRTIITEALGWKNAPKPLSNALDAGRNQLVEVLGVTDEIPESYAQEELTAEEILVFYEELSKEDASSLQTLICE